MVVLAMVRRRIVVLTVSRSPVMKLHLRSAIRCAELIGHFHVHTSWRISIPVFVLTEPLNAGACLADGELLRPADLPGHKPSLVHARRDNQDNLSFNVVTLVVSDLPESNSGSKT
jgi:hypothetical protein